MTRRDLETLVDRAMSKTGARSHRELSLKLGWAHNYVHNLLKGVGKPSEEALAQLHEAAGLDPTFAVLSYMRDKHDGTVRKIIDRAIKALSAAAIGLALLIGTSPDHSANAATHFAQQGAQKLYIMRQSYVRERGCGSAK